MSISGNTIVISGNSVFKTINMLPPAFENEKRALKLLTGHFAPKLISTEKNTLKMKKIAGHKINTSEITNEFIAQLAEALNYIHSIKHNGLSLVHGDLHKNNLLLNGQKIYLLDFTNSVFSNPLIDAAAVEIHFTTNKKLLHTFYSILNAKEDKQMINKFKVEHCKSHLAWSKEICPDLYQRSLQIIEGIENGKN